MLGRRQQPTQIDFFKDEHPRLVPLSKLAPRRCWRFTPPASLRRVRLGSGCPVEQPGCDSSRSLDTDVVFPCRPSGTDPLTTRRPCSSRPPVSSERSLLPGPRPVSHVPVKVTHCPDPGRLPSPGARSSRASYGRARSSFSAVTELALCHPIPLRLRPRCGPFHDVASLEELGHLAVVPPSGLGLISSCGVCRVRS